MWLHVAAYASSMLGLAIKTDLGKDKKSAFYARTGPLILYTAAQERYARSFGREQVRSDGIKFRDYPMETLSALPQS